MVKAIYYITMPIKSIMSSFVDLATPKSITYFWSMGSMLGLILVMQIYSGLFLSFYYISDTSSAFNSITYIMREVNSGWIFRFIHANGASLFFIVVYGHMGRGLYNSSYRFSSTWYSGSSIYLLLMGTGFLGYVLPWGQMSLWGAMVITNLISVIPILGIPIIQWVWGGFSMGNATLNCFYSIHYLLPFIILVMVILHMLLLHSSGNSMPIGLLSNSNKIKFDPLFTIKDSVNIVLFLMFLIMNLVSPFFLMEAENFIPASPMNSPLHIVPEWYFLYIYAILRSIPNKVGGVLALLSALLSIFLVGALYKMWKVSNLSFYKPFFWSFIMTFIMLTWIGGQPVEYPYVYVGMIGTTLYFLFFLSEGILSYLSNSLMK